MDRASAPPAHSSHYVAHLEYCIFIRKNGKSKNAPFIGKTGEGEGINEDRWRKYYRMNPSEVGTDHPNEKPLNLIRRLIMNSSKDGDLIFDPFIGSGTTAIAARDLNRFCIGVDKSGEVLETATLRLRQLTLGL
jgi:site-specific DNA-methyltransferase (adenine-specific)